MPWASGSVPNGAQTQLLFPLAASRWGALTGCVPIDKLARWMGADYRTPLSVNNPECECQLDVKRECCYELGVSVATIERGHELKKADAKWGG
jgi:hypothetical protein